VEPPTLTFRPRQPRNRRLFTLWPHPHLTPLTDAKVAKLADPNVDADSPSKEHSPHRMAKYTNKVTRDVDCRSTGDTDISSNYSFTVTVLRVINSEQALLLTTGGQLYKEIHAGKNKIRMATGVLRTQQYMSSPYKGLYRHSLQNVTRQTATARPQPLCSPRWATDRHHLLINKKDRPAHTPGQR
jgi:hypothetical protein